MTRDDRGRSVRLLDPAVAFTLGRFDVIERDDLEAVMREIDPNMAASGPRTMRWAVLAGVVGVLVLVGIFGAIALAGSPSARQDLVKVLLNPAIMVPCLTGMILPWYITRAERLKKVRRAMILHRHCPHCGYGLTGLVAEADGATVCPECGCAWRLPEGAPGSEGAAVTVPAQRRPVALLVALGVLTALAAAGTLLFWLR